MSGQLDFVIPPADRTLLHALIDTHLNTFEPIYNALVMEDMVTYQLPTQLGVLQVHETDHASIGKGVNYTELSSELFETRR